MRMSLRNVSDYLAKVISGAYVFNTALSVQYHNIYINGLFDYFGATTQSNQ